MHIEIKNDLKRDDLQRVENYIRNMPPVFTAAGFFQLNQGLFATFCSVFVSYFIIVIQFSTVADAPSTMNSDVATMNLSNYDQYSFIKQ